MKGLILETDSLNLLSPLIKVGGAAGININFTPLVSFPLSFILRRGVKDILIALTEDSLNTAKKLYGNGKKFNVNIEYKLLQKESFLAEEILSNRNYYKNNKLLFCSLNTILWGSELRRTTIDIIEEGFDNAMIFSKRITFSKNYETVLIDPIGNIIGFDLEETDGETSQVVPKAGLYPSDLVDIVNSLDKQFIYDSLRPINSTYLKMNRLERIHIHSNEIWYQIDDISSVRSLTKTIRELNEKHSILAGSPELSAYQSGLIDIKQYYEIIEEYTGTEYYEFLKLVK
jgi:glucose-1-phosphate thymidylyltransferase